MRPHMDPRADIDDAPELTECPWEEVNGKQCPNEPAEGEWFCHSHEEAGDADPAEWMRQRNAAEYQLDQAGHLT
ncbi:hypothetical protein F4561_002682 [Lipingzhangella halophila]|uniref:Uncharacterized protein n=1 Tax=Lipingzhangella halophila TaxID=1783352 RepID=A0A7W7RH38_9ACTN|nr:hypothetical protein [Lipingzhangella halophila]MBB4931862.1 hypothetical protein [Lipingzhangella halophila]